jgi:hypothetical protein
MIDEGLAGAYPSIIYIPLNFTLGGKVQNYAFSVSYVDLSSWLLLNYNFSSIF